MPLFLTVFILDLKKLYSKALFKSYEWLSEVRFIYLFKWNPLSILYGFFGLKKMQIFHSKYKKTGSIIGPRNFSGGTYDFSPVRSFVRPFVRPFVTHFLQVWWAKFSEIWYTASLGKSKRMSKPFFDFRKIRPGRAKKWPFFALFWPFWFLQFFGL